VLVHDEALLADPQLVDSVAAAARIALANARLQADAHAKTVELEASRRRIVEATDAQRRRIQAELELGAGRRLERVATLLAGARAADGDTVAPVEAALAAARAGLEEFARGVHRPPLAEGGLEAALAQLAERAAVPVEVRGTVRRLPAQSRPRSLSSSAPRRSRTWRSTRARRGRSSRCARRVAASVSRSPTTEKGGAIAARGSGLAGLADRVEALGGRCVSRVSAGADPGRAEILSSEPAGAAMRQAAAGLTRLPVSDSVSR
jgi:hypothetical protein